MYAIYLNVAAFDVPLIDTKLLAVWSVSLILLAICAFSGFEAYAEMSDEAKAQTRGRFATVFGVGISAAAILIWTDDLPMWLVQLFW